MFTGLTAGAVLLAATTATAAAVRLALLAGMIAGLSAPDFRDRDAAQLQLRRHAHAGLTGWSDVRRAWGEERDPEVKGRLYGAWTSATPTHAQSLLPAWQPLWPRYEGVDAWDRMSDYDAKEDAALIAWREAYGGDCKRWGSPRLWHSIDLTRRDAFKSWAIRELSLTGDVEKVRAAIAEAAHEERRLIDHQSWRCQIYDEGGLDHDAYQCVWLYDGGLINPAYFDGRRRPYPSPADPLSAFNR